MDSARQVIRWSIPGLLFFTNVLLLNTLVKVFGLGMSFTEVLDGYNHGGAVVAAVIASGIPIGFLLYQVYYSNYGPFAFRKFARIDRGGWFFAGLTDDERDRVLEDLGVVGEGKIASTRVTYTVGVPFLRLHRLIDDDRTLLRESAKASTHTEGVPFRLARPEKLANVEYRRRFYFNLRCAQSLLHQIHAKEKDNPLSKEYQTLSDLYHGLGAARTAVFAAALIQGSVVFVRLLPWFDERLSGAVYRDNGNLVWVVTTELVLMLLVAVQIWVLHQTRRHVWFNLCSTVQIGFKSYITGSAKRAAAA